MQTTESVLTTFRAPDTARRTMKTLLRAMILLLVSLWVGGVMFFPVVAWAAFSTLPDTHAAGTVVRLCLRTLHGEGLAAGSVLVVLLGLAGWANAYGQADLQADGRTAGRADGLADGPTDGWAGEQADERVGGRVDGRAGGLAFGRGVVGPLAATLTMLALTAFSQYSIMPRMEADRLAAGGAIDAAPVGDAHRVDFNRLHAASTRVEGGVLVAGVLLIVLLARRPVGE